MVSCPMVNPLSAMVRSLEKNDLYKFGQFYINTHKSNAIGFASSNKLTRGKYQKVPQILCNPKY